MTRSGPETWRNSEPTCFSTLPRSTWSRPNTSANTSDANQCVLPPKFVSSTASNPISRILRTKQVRLFGYLIIVASLNYLFFFPSHHVFYSDSLQPDPGCSAGESQGFFSRPGRQERPTDFQNDHRGGPIEDVREGEVRDVGKPSTGNGIGKEKGKAHDRNT